MKIVGEFTCDICGESFDTNVEIAGHMSGHQASVPPENILAELQRLAAEKDRPPMQSEVDEETEFTSGAIQSNFGSWREGLEAAELEPLSQAYTETDIIKELQRVANCIGHSPSVTEMRQHSTLAPTTVRAHFGTWNEGLRAAGLDTAIDIKVTKEEIKSASANSLVCELIDDFRSVSFQIDDMILRRS